MSGVMTGVKGLFGLATGSQKKTSDHVKQSKTSPADVVSPDSLVLKCYRAQ